MKTVYVKEWIAKKNYVEVDELMIEHGCVARVIKSTEKAVQVIFLYGPLRNYWFPKACVCETKEEWDVEHEKTVERQMKWEAEREQRFELGKKKHEMMVQFCKEHGLANIRTNMRKQTLLEKIMYAELEDEWKAVEETITL